MRRKLLGIVIVGLILAPWALADQGAPVEGAYDQVLSCFETFLGDLKGAIDSLNAADQDLEARYQALAVELKDAEATILQLQDAVAQIPGLADRIGSLEEKLNEVITAVHQLRTDAEARFAQLTDRIQAGEEALQSLAADFEAFKAEMESKLAALAQQLADEITKLSQNCDQKFAALKAQLDELAAGFSDMSAQLADHEARIAALEEQDLGSLQRRILALEQAAQALQIKIENSRAKIEGIEAALGGFTADIQANKDALASLTARVNEQDTRLPEGGWVKP